MADARNGPERQQVQARCRLPPPEAEQISQVGVVHA